MNEIDREFISTVIVEKIKVEQENKNYFMIKADENYLPTVDACKLLSKKGIKLKFIHSQNIFIISWDNKQSKFKIVDCEEIKKKYGILL